MKLFLIKSFIYSHPQSLKYLIYEVFFVTKYMAAEERQYRSRGEATWEQRGANMGAEERQHASRGQVTWEQRNGYMGSEERQHGSRGDATCM